MSGYTSIKSEVLMTLNERMPELEERFGVERICLFGSVARGEDTAETLDAENIINKPKAV